MSDRDILIVDDDTATLCSRMRELEADGWSVASYTFAKLEALSAKGALFVQHLKLESKILVDANGRLNALLRSFKPKKNYEQELAQNARLANLAGIVPNGPRGPLLAADILYVAVRNFGVLRLAERGIHLYSYDHILEALESEGLLGATGASALSPLRFLKCVYRAGETERGGHTLALLNRALSCLPTGNFPRSVVLEPPSAIISEAAPTKPASAYLLLRDLERRYVAMTAIVPKPVVEGDLALLSSWIANPRAYAALSGTAAPRLRAAIRAKAKLSYVKTAPYISAA